VPETRTHALTYGPFETLLPSGATNVPVVDDLAQMRYAMEAEGYTVHVMRSSWKRTHTVALIATRTDPVRPVRQRVAVPNPVRVA
jgi:hypothetical protein